MALVKSEEDNVVSTVPVVDDDSIPCQGTPVDEAPRGEDKCENKEETVDAEGCDEDEDELEEALEEICSRTIPILVAYIKVTFF
jgi:hypothetical protein